MDSRKIQFLIDIQKRIDQLEESSAEKKRLEKLKSRFYDLADVKDNKQYLDEVQKETIEISPNDSTKIFNDKGFISITTENLEITVKDKQKKGKEEVYNLNNHKPRDVSRFLSLFSSQSHPLKYLIHDYNEPGRLFIYKDFISEINDAFNIETKKHIIPPPLYSRIKTFIGIKDKKWFFKGKASDFKINSTKVKDWCDKNPNRHPILGFSDEFRFFRESMKIEQNLKEIINSVLAEKGLLSKFEIDFENVESASFNTDVDALMKALGSIFYSIAQRIKNGNNLKIIFSTKNNRELGRRRIIKIIHLSSSSDKELDENILFGGESNGGDFKSIKKSLYRVCDWSVIAENPNKKINRLNILFNPQTGIKPKEFTNETIEGFTHVLTFYS